MLVSFATFFKGAQGRLTLTSFPHHGEEEGVEKCGGGEEKKGSSR